ncbi:LysR family transcriptional regulator [Oceanibacterium hippocampi]|nr:LysR family transcriptional regulator [Oceanibacterium hippocampi]
MSSQGLADVDLKMLRVFATVVDCGGYAAAQIRLNLSAPSISGYMSALERRLGMRLCRRGRGGFELTEKGAEVYRESQRLFAAIDDFTAVTGALRGRLLGNLKVGMIDCVISDPATVIHHAIRRFHGRRNEVHLELVVDRPQELQRAVLDGRLDLAFGFFPDPVDGLESRPLHDETLEFYCGHLHPLFPQEKVSPDDLQAHRVVARGYWRREDIARVGAVRHAATVYHMEAQALLILSGRYLGYLPCHYAAAWVDAGEMRSLLPEQLRYHSTFALITRRNPRPSLVLSTFLTDVEAAMNELAQPGKDRMRAAE